MLYFLQLFAFQTYFEYGKRIADNQLRDRLNYHLLTIGVMKKLSDLPSCERSSTEFSQWFVDSNSILDVALTHIEYSKYQKIKYSTHK